MAAASFAHKGHLIGTFEHGELPHDFDATV
jgi:hypothetical protein